MKKYPRKFSILITFILCFQTIFPILNVLGAEIIGTPKNVTVNLVNANDIYFSWESVYGADYYRVYKLESDEKVLISQQSSTLWRKLKAEEGVYNLAVAAVKGVNESELSPVVNFEIDYPVVTSPENLTFSLSDVNNLKISWNSVPEATNYRIYQIKDSQKQLISTTTYTTKNLQGLAEGEYVYEIAAFSDRFGESTNNSQIKILIIYPKLQAPQGITYSLDNEYNLQLKWQPVEFATGYNIYLVDNSGKKLISTTTYTSKNFKGLEEGEYIYEISAINSRFGESEENNNIRVSVIYPDLKAPEWITATLENGNDVYLKWKQVENATSYNIYEIINGEKVLISNSIGAAKHLFGLTEGKHIYEVSADSALFGESPESATTSIEVEYPKMSAPVAQIEIKDSTGIFVSWRTVDYANSYNIYKVIDNELLFLENTFSNSYYIPDASEGRHEFVVTALNEYFGQSPLSNKVTADIKLNLESPTSDTPEVNGDEVKLDWSDVPGADSYNIYKIENSELTLVGNTKDTNLTIEDLPQGNYEFRIVPVSPEGIEGENYSTVIVEVEQIDTTAPQTVANETEEWIQGEYKVDLTATDDQSGVANTFYSINGSPYVEGTMFTVNEDDIHVISFYSVDNAGNEETPKTTVVKVDKTPPVTASDVTDNWSKEDVTVNLTATDDLSGVAKTFYSFNGTDFVEGTSFTVTEEGVQTVYFYSVDNAGNVESTKTAEVKIDKTAPETVSDVTDKWNKVEVTVNLTATDNLSGVDKTFYSLNGIDFEEGTSFKVNEQGVKTVYFYSVDIAGNIEEVRTAEVKIDNTAPETVSDVIEQWNNRDVTVNLTATDNLSGVDKTLYSLNGKDFIEGTSFTVNEEGVKTVYFYSVDNAGNVEEVKTTQVKIDNTAPETVSDVTDKWKKGEVTVTLTATDHLSGVDKTFYSLNGTDFVEGTSFTVNEEGVQTVYFYSVDTAGNVEEVKTAEVKIDKTAPQVSWDVKDQYALGTEFKVEFSSEDKLSGIASETVTLNGKVISKGDIVKLDQPGEYSFKVTVTDNAGWETTLEKKFLVYIPGELIVRPGIIMYNKGVFNVEVNLPKGISPNFDLSSVTVNGVATISKNRGLEILATKGHFLFNREDFDWEEGKVELEFRGTTVNGQLVIARTTVLVKDCNPKKAPHKKD